MRFVLLALLAVCLLSSCVSNKKVMMLQRGEVNQKTGLIHDSVVRAYAIDTFSYRIQPNDLISVRFSSLTPKDYDFFVMGAPQVGGNLQTGGALLLGDLVDEKGEIPFPVVGKVKVAGLTVFQIQDSLQRLATQYTEYPTVKVRLLNFRVTLLGEVAHEGTVTLLNNRVSLLEAIAQGGGLGELADRSNVKLIRQKGHQVEVQYLNLLSEDFIKSPYYYAYQNDVIIVPPLKQRQFRKYFGPNLALAVSTISLLLIALNLTK